jgi:hypothetical protein
MQDFRASNNAMPMRMLKETMNVVRCRRVMNNEQKKATVSFIKGERPWGHAVICRVKMFQKQITNAASSNAVGISNNCKKSMRSTEMLHGGVEAAVEAAQLLRRFDKMKVESSGIVFVTLFFCSAFQDEGGFYDMLSFGRRLELLTAVFLLAFFSLRVNLA